MNKAGWVFVGVAALIVVAVLIWWAVGSNREPTASDPETVSKQMQSSQDQVCGIPSAVELPFSQTIDFTDQGFKPSVVEVKIGQTVRWKNQAAVSMQVVSDPHPQHTECAGLDSGPVPPGGGYSFTFTEEGTWGVHDESNPARTGSVTVSP